jgi:hypothetical protein
MSSQSTPQDPTPRQATTPQPPTTPDDQPTPSNRAARRRKGKGVDPAVAGHHGAAGQPGAARATAQGRRINPVRRTGS